MKRRKLKQLKQAGHPVAPLESDSQREQLRLPLDDPLLNLDKFAVAGPGGKMTNLDIDQLLYSRL